MIRMCQLFRGLVILGAIIPFFAPSLTAQVTGNVLTRILLIRTSSGSGTGFTMDIDGRQYIVTAKHMVKGMTGKNTISLRENGNWVTIEVSVFPCADPVDIAVLAPPRILTVSDALEPSAAGDAIITQEVYFLGFPFGQSGADRIPVLGPHPLPIGKHGILSSVNDGFLLVDAYNNPGFSGAPIVFRSMYKTDHPTFYVLGVVQGFFPDLVAVTRPTPVKPGEELSNIETWRIQSIGGKKVILRDTDQKVPLNSGILTGYSIDYALKVIQEHPVGAELPKR